MLFADCKASSICSCECVNVLADDYTQKLKLNVIKHKLAIINETLFAC